MLQKKAALVCAELQSAGQLPRDAKDSTFVVTLLTILEILAALVQIYQLCKPPAAAAADMRMPWSLTRWRLRKEIRKHEDLHGRTDAVYDAILTVAGEVTDEEVTQMYAEVGSR